MAQPQQDLGGEQSSPMKAESDGLSREVICRGYCGFLGWTVVNHGRVTHKQSCPRRTEPWCQSHPKGCPSECVALGAVERTAHTSGSAADPKALMERVLEAPFTFDMLRDSNWTPTREDYQHMRDGLAAALVGVREQLRQAEQKVEEGARQKPREESESDRLKPPA